MKTKELRERSLKELQELLDSQRQQLRGLRFNLSFGKVKNIRQIRAIRKDIARILTIIREASSLKQIRHKPNRLK